jgi:hypothetical protein
MPLQVGRVEAHWHQWLSLQPTSSGEGGIPATELYVSKLPPHSLEKLELHPLCTSNHLICPRFRLSTARLRWTSCLDPYIYDHVVQ